MNLIGNSNHPPPSVLILRMLLPLSDHFHSVYTPSFLPLSSPLLLTSTPPTTHHALYDSMHPCLPHQLHLFSYIFVSFLFLVIALLFLLRIIVIITHILSSPLSLDHSTHVLLYHKSTSLSFFPITIFCIFFHRSVFTSRLSTRISHHAT